MSDAPAQATSATTTDAQKWAMELAASDQFLEPFHDKGTKVVAAFVDDRAKDEGAAEFRASRLNLFHANIVTLLALMYEKLPKVEADRRFCDPNDDPARVAGEMVTRILANDMNQSDSDLRTVLKQALWDRLVPGLGLARVRYCFEEDKQAKPVATLEGEAEPLYPKADEWCEEVYVHWRDVRWSPARTYQELRWVAFRSYMNREQATKRFGEEKAKSLSFTSKGPEKLLDGVSQASSETQIERQAEVWEIWDKDTRNVHWWAKGCQDLLDTKADPLKLDEFFPSAEPMAANLTTSKFLPKADFTIAQDIYHKIDELETRLSYLIDACKAVGVYAGDSDAVKNMLQQGIENQLIPVDNWAMYLERGGIKGAIEWFPIQAVAEVIQLLTIQQQAWIQKLYQVTGMSDILRGQATAQGATATEQKIKAQFGSVRISALQNEFAAFAQDLLNKKVQIIRNFYDPARIVELSNIQNTPDAQHIDAAIALIKDPEAFDIRVAVRSDSMAAVDMDALKAERAEFLQAVSQFVGQATQVATTMPEVVPFLMQLMKFGLAGYKGASEMEGVVDQAIAKLEQQLAAKASQPPQPSPEEKKLQMEGQLKQQEFGLKAQDMQQSASLEAQKQQFTLQIEREKFELEKQKMQMELMFKQRELELKMQEGQQKLAMQQAQNAQQMQHDETMAEIDHERAVNDGLRDMDSFFAEQDRAQEGFENDQARADKAAEAEAKRRPEPKT